GGWGRGVPPCRAGAEGWGRARAPPQAHGRLFALLRTTMQATPPAGAALAAVTLGQGTLAAVVAIAATMGLPAILLAHNLLSSATETDHGAPRASSTRTGQPGAEQAAARTRRPPPRAPT